MWTHYAVLLKAGANPNTECYQQPLEKVTKAMSAPLYACAHFPHRQKVTIIKDFAEAGARFKLKWIRRSNNPPVTAHMYQSTVSFREFMIREYVHGVRLHALDLFVVLTELNRTIVF
jgi:hypothetical protein